MESSADVHRSFKILDIDGTDLKNPYHGVDGKKVVPFGQWLRADIKKVKDGKSGPWYYSGFHVLPKRDEAVLYLRKFRNRLNKAIVLCEVENIWEKTHSNNNVLLAEWIRVLFVDAVVSHHNNRINGVWRVVDGTPVR